MTVLRRSFDEMQLDSRYSSERPSKRHGVLNVSVSRLGHMQS